MFSLKRCIFQSSIRWKQVFIFIWFIHFKQTVYQPWRYQIPQAWSPSSLKITRLHRSIGAWFPRFGSWWFKKKNYTVQYRKRRYFPHIFVNVAPGLCMLISRLDWIYYYWNAINHAKSWFENISIVNILIIWF